jgi:hypothetical protein
MDSQGQGDPNLETEKVLVTESLQETLWRLEEVRQGFRRESAENVQEALKWVLARQGLQGSYLNLFTPTELDLTQGLQLITGERKKTKAATRHILGEEALRTLSVWNLAGEPAARKALKGLNLILDRGGKSGSYCCYTCTMAFLRTLAEVKPKGWDVILEKGLNRIRLARTPYGRWHGFPFYYTLLTLSEMNTPSAQAELKHAGKTAEKLLKKYSDEARVSRFRRLGLEAALNSL